MARITFAICGERDAADKGWNIRRYAFLDGEDGRLTDEREAYGYLKRLVPGAGETKTWIVGQKPPSSMTRFFDVYLVVDKRMTPAKYDVDRHAYPSCPSPAVDDGMSIFRAIRKYGVRPAVKTMIKKSEERRAKRKAFKKGLKHA